MINQHMINSYLDTGIVITLLDEDFDAPEPVSDLDEIHCKFRHCIPEAA